LQAADYIVRVEKVGYIDVPESEINPTSEVLQSIEVMCKVGSRARVETKNGKETITLDVMLRSAERPESIAGKLDYCETLDTGVTILDKSGKRVPLPSVTKASTGFTAQLNERFNIGGFLTSLTESGKTVRSKVEYLGVVERYAPAVAQKSSKQLTAPAVATLRVRRFRR
jgi:hypothetical protein